MWYLYVFLSRSESVALCVRGGYTLKRYCVTTNLWVDFHSISPFWKGFALSDLLESSHFRRQVAPQFSRNCGRKFRKLQNRRKSLCPPLRLYTKTGSHLYKAERFQKMPPPCFRARNVGVHLYKTISAYRYSADSKCQTSYR